MSLPVGQYSWGDRWVCTGDEEMLPYEVETHSSKRMNDPKFRTEAANPRQARHASDVPSSVYTESYSQPGLHFKHTSQTDRISEYITYKHARDAQKNQRLNKPAPPYDHCAESQKMWMRVNPGFHQQPFRTESSDNYVSHTEEAHPINRAHYLKSMNLQPVQPGSGASKQPKQ